jgi:hypothetical protein
MSISSLDYCLKNQKMFFNANNLGLNVEITPPIIHMHLYLNYKEQTHHQDIFIKTYPHETRKKIKMNKNIYEI